MRDRASGVRVAGRPVGLVPCVEGGGVSGSEQARVVVIGGGITGVSVAYHLALAGETDVLLLEKSQLTGGATAHAAGLVTAFNPSATMMGFRRYSIGLYERLGGFERSGSLRLASSQDQLRELQRTASRARGIGLDVELIAAVDAVRLLPEMSARDLFGAVYLPGDGSLDPHTTTHAIAAAARRLGVRVQTGVRVTGIELSDRREVKAVVTERGRIATEIVVNAAGLWAPRIAEMVGGFAPSTPVDHQHVALRAVPGYELPAGSPCFRDPDNLVYGKAEAGGVLFGGYETNPASRWEDGVPWDHAARSLTPDYDRFEPLMAGVIRRFPFLADAEVVRLVCHPDAMTPDANPLLGPMPGARGFWVAAGLSLNGFGAAGGIGQAIASWITTGDPGVDIWPYRAWRFAGTYRDPSYAAACARETYADYYRQRYPFDADEAGRPRRLSAVHGRLQDAGAVFGTKAGWERADHLEPGAPWRRSGRDQRAYGFTRPPWLDRVGEEHRAVRERVGLIDLSSFGKIWVSGPGALETLQYVSANDIDRPVGSIVYTQWLNDRAGIVADVTVTREANDRFTVMTGAGYVAADVGWLELNGRESDLPMQLQELSDSFATFGLWGPKARRVLQAITKDDVSNIGLPLRQARDIHIGGAPVKAGRISYAGELGWELTMTRNWAVSVWDRLVVAGAKHGLAIVGYRALESLRLEKGYRYFGTDLTTLDTPDEAGLAAFVRPERSEFRGRSALLARREADPDGPARRLRTVRFDGPDYVPVYGGEAVRVNGEVVGRLRSAGYVFTTPGTIGTVYLPGSMTIGDRLEVDVFDERVAASVGADVQHDPDGARMRG